MYKGRIGIWISVIICCMLITTMIKKIPTWFETEDLTVKVSVKNDNGLSEMLSRNKINGYCLHLQDEDTDMVISDNINTISGYSKISGGLFSPIVMYVSANVYNHSDGFIKMGNNSYAFKVDLYTILTAIEDNSEWQDIGFSNKIIKGPVTIHIPNEQTSYYNEVIELFYLTLNNGDIPDGVTREKIKPRVDRIVDKCVKVVDINQEVYEEYKNSSTNHKVFIGPEYLFRRGAEGSMNRHYADAFQPVYFTKTITLYSDIFIRESEDNSNVNKFIQKITEKNGFMSCTGWRVKNSTFYLDEISSAYIKEPNL